MKVEIRDYRGVERADIDLSHIALVAGQNEQGKSCVAEALRAALTGNPIPIAGVLKKDAKLLVRDGADHGSALVTILPDCGVQVNWPDCAVTVDGDSIQCSDYASGLSHVMDLNLKDRSKVLADYMKSIPTKHDLELAAADAGYSKDAVAKIWESIDSGGWDATYTKTRDYTVNLKGQWQGITGEKYGALKGENFCAEGNRDLLADALLEAEDAILDTAGALAVSEAEIAALKRTAANEIEDVRTLNDDLKKARDRFKDLQAERDSMPDDPAKAEDKPKPLGCPDCGAALSLLAGRLVSYVDVKPEKPLPSKVIMRRDYLDETLADATRILTSMDDHIRSVARSVKEKTIAQARLDEIAKAPKLDDATVELAKNAASDARSALNDFDNKVKAHKIHGNLIKNDLLIKVLAPEGLRKRVLATKLDEFNESLNILCTAAGWAVVRIDESLDCHYGKRPLWAASMSGQWRARAVIQVAMAQMDGSAAVILDEADMLDTKGRNGLFAMLGGTGVRALVCMTFGGRERVPNLKQAGLGVSYWIENGVAEEL